MKFATKLQERRTDYEYNRTVAFWIVTRELLQSGECSDLKSSARIYAELNPSKWQRCQEDLESAVNDPRRPEYIAPDDPTWRLLVEYANNREDWRVIVSRLESTGTEQVAAIGNAANKSQHQLAMLDRDTDPAASRAEIMVGLSRSCEVARRAYFDNRAATHWILTQHPTCEGDFPVIEAFVKSMSEREDDRWNAHVDEIEYMMHPESFPEWVTESDPKPRRPDDVLHHILREYNSNVLRWKDVLLKLESDGKKRSDHWRDLLTDLKNQENESHSKDEGCMVPQSVITVPYDLTIGKNPTIPTLYRKDVEESPRMALSILPIPEPDPSMPTPSEIDDPLLTRPGKKWVEADPDFWKGL